MAQRWLKLILPVAVLAAGLSYLGRNAPSGRLPPTGSDPEPQPSATPRPYRLQPGQLVLATTEDSIPSIDAQPSDFIGREQGDQEWGDVELVIGLALDGQAKAYPVRLLSLHEIVNDHVGEEAVAVTWCPLCFTPIVFERRVAGQELTFDVSGYLLENNLVMVDRQTGTLWSQLLAQSVRGPLRRSWLEILPSRLVTWGDWKGAHPETLVLSARSLGYDPAALIDPYAGYYSSGAVGLGDSADDDRLPAKAVIVGVSLDGQALALLPEQVRQAWPLQLTIANRPMLVVYDQSLQAVIVYERVVDGTTLDFSLDAEGELIDHQSGTTWRPRDGVGLRGPLAERELVNIPATVAFWFAWSSLHPNTLLHGQQ